MAGRRMPLDFDSQTGRFSAGSDVHIGAYARRQLRRRIAAGVFGVFLIVAAVGVYLTLRSDKQSNWPVISLRCTACGDSSRKPLPAGQAFPMACPKCKANAVRPLWTCRRCGESFVPTKPTDITTCPKCGSDLVGAAQSQPVR